MHPYPDIYVQYINNRKGQKMTHNPDRAQSPINNKIAVSVILYGILYIFYLWFFIDFENETTHWLTLVLIPFILLWLMMAQNRGKAGIMNTLRHIGFKREHLKKGIFWGIILGLLLGVVQLGMSRKGEMIWEIIRTGKVFYRLPIAFLLVFITAGFTEEFFFRGILQGTLAKKFNRQWPAILIASFLFGLYHFPYAYLLDTWPTHGNIAAAIQEGVIMSAIMGIVLGIIYARTRHLIAPIICHSLFNAVMLMPNWNFNINFG